MALSGGIDFDFSGPMSLAADLGRAAVEVIPNVRKALEVSSVEIKKDWVEEAKKSNPEHAARYPRSIDYDLELDTDGEMSAEIGPNLAKAQGALGILEEAPGGVDSAPQGNARRALRKNLAGFERGILKATEGLL